MGWIAWVRSNRGRLIIVSAILGIFILLILFAGGVTAWEYTNSSEFCGTTCHTMPPEYRAYQVSPHARVPCVDCHLGQESVLNTVPRKAKEIRHVVFALTQRYETPLYVKSLRPARETCEKCHNPDKFSTDSIKEIKRYAPDQGNSETRIYLVLKTGGGSKREGLGKGIHWHIENEVWYIATDPLRQEIPYVRQVDDEGNVTEYFDVTANLPADFVEKNSDKLRRMDCIDCHNRVSHTFRSPERSMDLALSRKLIDRSIPFIKKKGVEVLSQPYASHEEARAAIEALEQWYRENEPFWYQDPDNQAKLAAAIERLKAIYEETVFPELDVGWETHPDNLGHQEFPGCFRCHDGKHLSQDQTAIRLECNICHTIPIVVRQGEQAPVLDLSQKSEPRSHLDSNWLARHRFEFDQTCAQCHDVSNPGGADNSSFCSNSACHATEWKYVGLNAPAIREMLRPQREKSGPTGIPPEVPHPAGPRTDCLICHGLEKVHPYPESHASLDVASCTTCHRVPPTEATPTAEAAETPATAAPGTPTPTTAVAGPPAIPHPLEGRDDCLVCHAVDSPVKPAPPDHAGRPVEVCQACHQLAAVTAPAPTSTPTATATPTLTSTPTPTAGVTPTPTPSPRAVTATPGLTATATLSPTVAPTATFTPTPSPPPTEAAGSIPTIPHTLEGRDDCLLCHAPDSVVKPAPADHAGRTNESCQACHKPGS